MISEFVVNQILEKKKLKNGVNIYNYLLNNRDTKPITENEIFKKKYIGFYGLSRGLSDSNKDKYFENMEKNKHENISFKNDKNCKAKGVFLGICDITGRCEISFASKMLHHLDSSFPIWDSVVATQHFKFKRINTGDLNMRKDVMWNLYLKYIDNFYRYMQSPDGKKIIKLFDDKFCAEISDVKKIDFVLWQDKQTKIEIPDEFCNQLI